MGFRTFFFEVHMTQQTFQQRKQKVLDRVSLICPRQRKNRGIPRIAKMVVTSLEDLPSPTESYEDDPHIQW
jgi:hypothetical protein